LVAVFRYHLLDRCGCHLGEHSYCKTTAKIQSQSPTKAELRRKNKRLQVIICCLRKQKEAAKA